MKRPLGVFQVSDHSSGCPGSVGEHAIRPLQLNCTCWLHLLLKPNSCALCVWDELSKSSMEEYLPFLKFYMILSGWFLIEIYSMLYWGQALPLDVARILMHDTLK